MLICITDASSFQIYVFKCFVPHSFLKDCVQKPVLGNYRQAS